MVGAENIQVSAACCDCSSVLWLPRCQCCKSACPQGFRLASAIRCAPKQSMVQRLHTLLKTTALRVTAALHALQGFL